MTARSAHSPVPGAPPRRWSASWTLLVLLAAGCATAHGPAHAPVPPPPPRPADEGLSPDTALTSGGPAQVAYAHAYESLTRGDAARDAGEGDRARSEWTAAADGLLSAEKAGATAWRLPLGYRAAELLARAGDFSRSAEVATGVARDPGADARSRALAWHLAAQALANQGTEESRAGRLAPIKLVFADQRGPEPLSPQPPPGTWKRFQEAVDAYLAVSQADPLPPPPAGEQTLASPGRLAVGAAKVSFSFEDMADARRRLEAALERWPDDADAQVEAVPLLLQTYLVQGDRAGFLAAAARLEEGLSARAEKADPRGKEGIARVQEELRKAVSGAAFADAQRLLEAGKPAEAAQAFEAIAAGGAGADAAGALHNAAIAWDRASDPARAAAARERILKERPEARVAPGNTLLLAAYQSRKGDHAGSARLYTEFLERWPEHANRCIAMQNVASELDASRRGPEAAERYLAFGRDGICARVDPPLAATALRRARVLFDAAGKPVRAREAAAAAEALGKKPAKEKTP